MLAKRLLLRRAPLAGARSYTTPSSGYGDPDQTGFGVSTEDQSRTSISLEHPGPPPVDEGKGTGSGGFAETGRVAAAQAQAQEAPHKPQPRITPNSEPAGKGDKDVERHNLEMSRRYGKTPDGQEDQKVGKGYWTSTCLILRVARVDADGRLDH